MHKFWRFTCYGLILLCYLSFDLNGQKIITWFDAGIKAQFGGSGLYNKAILNANSLDYELDLSNSFGLGGRVGINWDEIGISLEGMYNSNQSSIKRLTSNNKVDYIDHSWNVIDIYTLLRSARNLGYLEFGPKFSVLQNVKQNIAGVASKDISSQYNTLNYGAILGFGSNVIGVGETFTGMLGIRIEYNVSDFITEGDGRRQSAPLNLGNLYDQGYKSTHPLFIGLVFEANFGIGYFGRAKCGARTKFMRF